MIRLRSSSVAVLVTACSAFSQTYTIQTFAGGGLPENIPGASASLNYVRAVAVDASGNVFLAVSAYAIVLRLDSTSGILTRVAGTGISGYSGDGGPAINAQLNGPAGLAVDGSGNLYIADTGNLRVREVANGIITTVAGGGTLSSDDIPATNAALQYLNGIGVDPSGNLYIPDTVASKVRMVSKGTITTVAGNGTSGYNGDGIPATSAELNNPTAVAVDCAGNLYIAESGNKRVRMVSKGTITTVAGNGTAGYNGDGIPATSAELDLVQPYGGIAADCAGNVYIPDMGNNRVRRVSNGVITTVAGNGAPGYNGDGIPATSAQLYQPSSVAVDSSGNLYIGDSSNGRVRGVSNGTISTVAGGGNAIGDSGPASSAQLAAPAYVSVDPAGNVYIGDTGDSRVRKVSKGVITTVAGNGNYGYNGDGIQATSATLRLFNWPGVAADASGNVYIADAGNNRVRKVSNGVITTVAGNGTAGYSGDGIPAATSEVCYPGGIKVDSESNVIIADAAFPCNRVRKVSNGVITTVAGDGTYGYSGDGVLATSAALRGPNDVALSGSGDLYVVDESVIQKISNGVITTVAGNSTANGCDGDGVPATVAYLYEPWGVAIDSTGSLYIADVGGAGGGGCTGYARLGNSIRKVSGGVINTIAGILDMGFSGDGGAATSAQFNSPSSVAVDTAGNVYVADPYNHRIRVLIPSGPACTYSVAPLVLNVPGPGGIIKPGIQTASGCTWAIQNLPDWITLSGNAVAAGSGSVTITVAANNGSPRSALISVAGIPVTVSQSSNVLQISTGGTVGAASYTAPVVPGSLTSIFGNFLLSVPVFVNSFPIPSSLGGLSFQFTGTGSPAPIFYANVGQANVQVPWELTGQSQTTIVATLNGQSSTPQPVELASFAPGIFTTNGEGTGQGAVLDANYHLVDSNNPAIAGATVILIYCTGLGAVTNQPSTGTPAPVGGSPSVTMTTPTVTIGGAPPVFAEFSGLAPGFVGLYQVNVRVPSASTRGTAVPVTMSIGGTVSNSVTIAVQ